MEENVAISVIMPVYNAELYIKECMDSILNQTLDNFELIIIDDCSIDNTNQIISSYQDRRIKFFRNEINLGLTLNLNKAINISCGKYIVRMDSDDICMPSRFEVQYRFMETHPDVGLCGTWLEVFGDRQAILKYKTFHEEIILRFLYECHLVHPTVIIRKKIMTENNIYYDPLFFAAQDYDIFSKLASVCKLANIPEILLKYRSHSESVTSKRSKVQFLNSSKIIFDQFLSIGIKLNNDEINSFVMFCNSKFNFDFNTICNIEELLIRIIRANEYSQYLNPEFLKLFLCDKWFHTCYNSTYFGLKIYEKYFTSYLYNYQKIVVITRVKFFIKCLFRKK